MIGLWLLLHHHSVSVHRYWEILNTVEKKLFVVVKYFGLKISGLEKYRQNDNTDFLEEHSEVLKIKRGLNSKKKRCFSFNIDTLPVECTVQIKEIFTCIYDY